MCSRIYHKRAFESNGEHLTHQPRNLFYLISRRKRAASMRSMWVTTFCRVLDGPQQHLAHVRHEDHIVGLSEAVPPSASVRRKPLRKPLNGIPAAPWSRSNTVRAPPLVPDDPMMFRAMSEGLMVLAENGQNWWRATESGQQGGGSRLSMPIT